MLRNTKHFLGSGIISLLLIPHLSMAEEICQSSSTAATYSSDDNMSGQPRLIWSDEFNVDGNLDSSFWNFEQGFARNHEYQWYQTDNAYCKDGMLVIECRKESSPNPLYEEGSKEWRRSRPNIEYTSSSVNTKDKVEFTYGTLEVRARIPIGPGAWPAIWTLGTEKEWPSNGEIDVLEYYRIKGIPHILANAAWGTDIRYNAKWNSKRVPFSEFTEKDPDWSSKFHIWKLVRDDKSIKIYLDDALINDIDLSTTENPDGFNPMQQPHYILLNLALGGDNGGEPHPDAFPLRYEIDYVRLYDR